MIYAKVFFFITVFNILKPTTNLLQTTDYIQQTTNRIQPAIMIGDIYNHVILVFIS